MKKLLALLVLISILGTNMVALAAPPISRPSMNFHVNFLHNEAAGSTPVDMFGTKSLQMNIQVIPEEHKVTGFVLAHSQKFKLEAEGKIQQLNDDGVDVFEAVFDGIIETKHGNREMLLRIEYTDDNKPFIVMSIYNTNMSFLAFGHINGRAHSAVLKHHKAKRLQKTEQEQVTDEGHFSILSDDPNDADDTSSYQNTSFSTVLNGSDVGEVVGIINVYGRPEDTSPVKELANIITRVWTRANHVRTILGISDPDDLWVRSIEVRHEAVRCEDGTYPDLRILDPASNATNIPEWMLAIFEYATKWDKTGFVCNALLTLVSGVQLGTVNIHEYHNVTTANEPDSCLWTIIEPEEVNFPYSDISNSYLYDGGLRTISYLDVVDGTYFDYEITAHITYEYWYYDPSLGMTIIADAKTDIPAVRIVREWGS